MQMEGGASYKDEFLVIMALQEAYYTPHFLHRNIFPLWILQNQLQTLASFPY